MPPYKNVAYFRYKRIPPTSNPLEQVKNILIWIVRSFFISRRSDLKVVILCFIAATTFWFLNALNKDYSTRLLYPVTFVFDDSTYIATRPLPDKLALNVSGYGWNLLRKSVLPSANPLQFAIPAPMRTHYLTGITMLPSVTEQLQDIRVNYIMDDTLFFDFDRRVSKQIALRVDSANVSLAENYRIVSPISLEPAFITLEGPATLVGKLPNEIYIDLPTEDIDEEYNETLPVDYIQNSLITADEARVRVRFAVAPFVREMQRVPIQTVSFPEKNPPALPSPESEVQYWVRQEDADKARLQDFRVVANYDTYNPKDSTVRLSVVMRPGFVRDVAPLNPTVKLRYE